MKYFIILIAFAFVISFCLQSSFAVTEFLCNVDNSALEKTLNKNSVVNQFLEFHPSSSVMTSKTSDELGIPFTLVEYYQNGLGLAVSIFENDSGTCFVKSYDVSYEYPSSGLGVSLSKGQHFENEQEIKAVLAVKDLTNPRKQMKNGIPLYEIKCKEGLNPIPKRDRVTPACVTDSTWNELLKRGWTPLRLGMPAETNVLITYNATMVYPQKVSKEYDPRSPYFNFVFFVNNDIVPHTINAIDESWSTGIIESGKTGSMTFNDTASYKYYVAERPETTGTILFEPMAQNLTAESSQPPAPEPEPDPIPEETPNTTASESPRYVSPFDEKLIHEYQKYHTVITGKVVEWYGQKQPSKYYYQYRVEPLAFHTPRMQDDPIYIIMGNEDNFIPVDADAVLFGLDVDDQNNLYIKEFAVFKSQP